MPVDAPPVQVEGQLAIGGAVPSGAPLVAGASGGLVVRLGASGFALEATGRELVAGDPARSVGGLGFDARWPAGPGPHALLGFAHHHEAPLADARAAPIANALGILESITHRTGFEVGAGWDGGPVYTETAFLSRLRPTAQVQVVVLPATGEPLVYAYGSFGIALALGPVGQ